MMVILLNKRMFKNIQKYNDANVILFKNRDEIIKYCKDNLNSNIGKLMKYLDNYLNLDEIGKYGYLSLLIYINKYCPNIEFSTDSMDLLVISGNLDIIRWFHQNRTEGCSFKAMDYAAKEGHIEIVKWLHENRTEGCSSNAMDFAAENGHLNIVKWLHNNRTEGCTTNAIDYAAKNGHIEIVKWFYENRDEGCSPLGIYYACQNNRFDIEKFLLDHYDNLT